MPSLAATYVATSTSKPTNLPSASRRPSPGWSALTPIRRVCLPTIDGGPPAEQAAVDRPRARTTAVAARTRPHAEDDEDGDAEGGQRQQARPAPENGPPEIPVTGADRLIKRLAVQADEGDDRLVVPVEIVAGRTRGLAGEHRDRLPAVPRPGKLPDALVVGLDLPEARQDSGQGGTGMRACLRTVEPEEAHAARVRLIGPHGGA